MPAMAFLLRRTHPITRPSRQLLEAATLSQTLARRPVSLPRPLYAYARSRSSSSRPRKSQNQDAQKKHKSSGSSPKGMEYLYQQSSPMSSNPPPPGKKPKEDEAAPREKSKLTPTEEKALIDAFKTIEKGMPPSMAKDLEKATRRLAQEGMSQEWRDIMNDINAKGLSSMRAARLWALASRMARDMPDMPDEEVEKKAKQQENPQQKTGEDPGPKSDGPKPKQENKGEKSGAMSWDWSNFASSIFITWLIWSMLTPAESRREITWQEFRTTFLAKGLVEKLVVVNGSHVQIHMNRENVAAMYPESPAARPNFHYIFSIGSVEAFERKVEDAQAELGIPSSERIPISYHMEQNYMGALFTLAPTLIIMGATFYMFRRSGGGAGGGGSGIFGMGKSRAKKFNHETDIKVTFADVAGADEAKMEIMEFVSFLKEPERFQKLGAKIPRGAILSGPPGTGKTLLAKATAGESGVPFFSVSGSEFVEMFVGVGPSRVRDLFANARKNTPCIIFIDEIDAIGKARSKTNFGGGNDERESTLNQILTEMDGFNTADQVVVLAGTNRADVLDKALMRPGRFDRNIAIDAPTIAGRKQIFAVHLKKIVTHEDMENLTGRLSALTPGFSGADIANVVNEAALIAARTSSDSVKMADFEGAIERVIGGLEKKTLVLSPEEKKTVAYHEAGHAVCGWYFQWADPLLKVSIIPRGSGALGYAQYLPGGGADAVLMNMRQMMDRMAMTLGGRVSEELHFDTVTSGASDDFNKVTRMATAMVTKWGMSEKLGYIYYPDGSESQDAQVKKPFSEATAIMIDEEVKHIITEAYNQCKQLLVEKKAEVVLVAEELLRKEVLSRDDMVRLLGPRQWASKGDFDKFFGGGGEGKNAGGLSGSEGEGPNPGSIGDSGSGPNGPAPGAGNGGLPGGLGRGGEEPLPALYKGLEGEERK